MSKFKTLPRNVIVVGLVSFFNDLASEMVTPLIPLLLAGMMGAGPMVLGLVEGLADAISAYVKLLSGRYSDFLGGRRKVFAVAGYFLSNLVRPLMGVAASWPQIMGLRATDRVGKGIRTAPRDALISDATTPGQRGLAYGFHRAMDNGGAMAGSLLAAAILSMTDLDLSQVILLSIIPGMMGVLLFAFGVKESPRPVQPQPLDASAPPREKLVWSGMSVGMRRYLIALALFTFARASETFVVLRGHEMGATVVTLLLLWSALSACKAVSSYIGGSLADRLGHEQLVLVGWLAHALGFTLLAFADTMTALWVAAIVYGALTGLAEGAERAVIGACAKPDERGTAFGWYNMVLGLAAVPAGLIFGGLWQLFDAATAFFYAAALSAASALLLKLWVVRALRAANNHN